MKTLLDILEKLDNKVASPLGWFAIALILLSLYPPLSFIPKFFVLFALTH
jgi:hypothetical protein